MSLVTMRQVGGVGVTLFYYILASDTCLPV